MDNIQGVISKSAIPRLRDSYNRLGLKASGEWERGLDVQRRGGKVYLKGYSYTNQIVNGRKPNKDQSKDGLRRFAAWGGKTWAEKWVRNKRINRNPFAVAYNIGKNGTAPKKGKHLFDTLKERSFKEEIKSGIKDYYLIQSVEMVKKMKSTI